MERIRDDPVEVVVGGLFHRHLRPPLTESYRNAGLQTVVADEILHGLLGEGEPALSELGAEFDACWESLSSRVRPGLKFAEKTAFRRPEASILYAWIRRNRPSRVVETGVANGYSSCVLLEALRRNGTGTLTSFDIVAGAGELVPPELRTGWDLQILPSRGRAAAFGSAIRALGPIGLFLHDSDHSYRWMEHEMRLGWAQLTPGGLLAADDIDWSYAFLDFARAVGVRPLVLVDASKPFGLLPRPGPPRPS
jgi:predicted O-methyltransferase YrrM